MKKIFLLCTLFIVKLYSFDIGETLWQGNCITCHHPTKSISAPSAKEIKQRYLTVFPQKEDFVAFMAQWVHNPQSKTSIMDDAIKKYGLMPQMAFPLDTTTDIAKYLYKTEF